MKSALTRIALSSLLLGSILMAGKNVVPVDAPVAPVAFVNPLPLYVGVGLLWSGTSRDCPCADGDNRIKDTSYGGIVRVGYDFNPYIGIEGRVLKATYDNNFAETTHYGIYLKPQYHVTDALNVYALIGYGKTKIDCDTPSISQNMIDVDGLSVGIGLEYDISSDEAEGAYARSFDGKGDQEKGLGVWVDYQNLLHDEGNSNVKANIISTGLTYDF